MSFQKKQAKRVDNRPQAFHKQRLYENRMQALKAENTPEARQAIKRLLIIKQKPLPSAGNFYQPVKKLSANADNVKADAIRKSFYSTH